MNFVDQASHCGFRVVDPSARADESRRFHVGRPDGSTATLLNSPHFPLDVTNADIGPPSDWPLAELMSACGVRRMSTFMVGALLNAAVRSMPQGTAYVNVGVWNGFSMFAGMAGNPERTVFGIDDFSQFGGPRDAFLTQFFARRTGHHRFFDLDYLDFFARGLDQPIGVYLYDGEHSYENQLRGLQVAEPYFANDCLIVIDDTNVSAPRRATADFMERSERDYSVLLDASTADKKHPTLWNGLMVLGGGSSAELPALEQLRGPETVSFVDSAPRLDGNEPLVSVVLLNGAGHEPPHQPFDYPNIELLVVPEGPDAAAEAVNRSAGSLIALVDLTRVTPPASALSEAVTGAIAAQAAVA